MEENHMLAPDEPPSYTQSHIPQNTQQPVSALAGDKPPLDNACESAPSSTMSEETLTRPVESVVQKPQLTSWPSSNPFVSYYQPLQRPHGSPGSGSTRGVDSPGAMDLDDSHVLRCGSVLSIDDPDVRLAAEALGDLRADFVQSPNPSTSSYHHRRNTSQQPEPLLSLLTTSHPLVGSAIDGSISAYSASKNYSPRFKLTAEYVERRVSPVVNKVGSVGRVTGVEGGVRWFLGGRRRGHDRPSAGTSSDDLSNKRRKMTEDTDQNTPYTRSPHPSLRQEPQLQHRDRRNSQASSIVESLPAYDEYKSPSYEASQNTAIARTGSNSPTSPSSWQSRLVLSTSGLSIAMSEESLRSLKYCLGWLRWANEHIGNVVNALKSVLEQCNSNAESRAEGILSDGENGNSESASLLRTESDREALTKRIAELKTDVLKTLKDVVDVVSKYTGGALPENARVLVRSHLTSLPQRFKLANTSTPPQSGDNQMAQADWETREGAKRVIVLAKEGLDMMTQVSGVLDGTIVSAEEWCKRLGKKTSCPDQAGDDMLKEGLSRLAEERRTAFDEAQMPLRLAGGDHMMGQAM